MEGKLGPGESENSPTDPKKWVKFGEEADNEPDNSEEIRLPGVNSNTNIAPTNNSSPAVIEPSTTVAVLPSVQIQSPPKTPDVSLAVARGHVVSYPGGVRSNVDVFVNTASLQNIELRNSETSLSTAGNRNGSSRRTRTGFSKYTLHKGRDKCEIQNIMFEFMNFSKR